MPTELAQLHKRGTDSVAQTRCDRRTLATLAQYFSKQKAIGSISSLIRDALELTERAILSEDPDLEVLTMEEAEQVLESYFGDVSLNPDGKNVRMYQRQLERESAFSEGRAISEVHTSRVTKGQKRSSPQLNAYLETLTKDDLVEMTKGQKRGDGNYKPRMPEGVVESVDESIDRRKEENKKLKEGLSEVPKEVVKED